MINVNDGEQQGDAHLLSWADGTHILIDTGHFNVNKIVKELRKRHVNKIQAVVISHMHDDHYGGLRQLIESDIRIDTVYLNIPASKLCEIEAPWGCRLDHINEYLEQLKSHKITIKELTAGQVFYEKSGIVLMTKYIYTFETSPIAISSANDTSAIMTLETNGLKILFPGDLDRKLADYLTATVNDNSLASQILKVPHHGTEGVAGNNFFDKVGAKLALVPSPTNLWLSERSRRIREYFEKHHVPVAVNGIHGNVTVYIKGGKYRVITEKEFIHLWWTMLSSF